MGVLEQINEMKQQGASEDDIISELRQKGVSPRQINEALNQSKIKSAVSGVSGQDEKQDMEKSMMPQKPQKQSSAGQGSKTQEVGQENQDYYAPQPQNAQQGQLQVPQPSQQQDYQNYPRQQYQEPAQQNYKQQYSEYPEQGQYYEEYPEYADYGYDYNYDYGSTDTFIEIAEQVFAEKIKDMEKKVDELNEIKSIAKVKLDNVNERVKRMESAFDKLQAAILNKIGSYGNTLEGIKKEMSMLENSFGKIAKSQKSKSTRKKSKKTHSKKKKSKKKSK